MVVTQIHIHAGCARAKRRPRSEMTRAPGHTRSARCSQDMSTLRQHGHSMFRRTMYVQKHPLRHPTQPRVYRNATYLPSTQSTHTQPLSTALFPLSLWNVRWNHRETRLGPVRPDSRDDRSREPWRRKHYLLLTWRRPSDFAPQ